MDIWSRYKTYLSASLFALICALMPTITWAGILDFFSIGSISEATWKIALIRMIGAAFPLISVTIVLILATVTAVYGVKMVQGLSQVFREALKDDKITFAEWIIITMEYVLVVPLAIVMIGISSYGSYYGLSGLSEVLDFVPPSVEVTSQRDTESDNRTIVTVTKKDNLRPSQQRKLQESETDIQVKRQEAQAEAEIQEIQDNKTNEESKNSWYCGKFSPFC